MDEEVDAEVAEVVVAVRVVVCVVAVALVVAAVVGEDLLAVAVVVQRGWGKAGGWHSVDDQSQLIPFACHTRASSAIGVRLCVRVRKHVCNHNINYIELSPYCLQDSAEVGCS